MRNLRLSYHAWCQYHQTICQGSGFNGFFKKCNYIHLKNGHMSCSRYVSCNGGQTNTTAEHKLPQRLCELQTTDELLNLTGKVDSESWTPELALILTERLVHTHYQSLRAIYPWMQEKPSNACKQLLACDPHVIQAAFDPVHSHPAYRTWTNIVQRNCTSFTGGAVASALFSATHLFVNEPDSLVHCLVSEMHRHLPVCDLTSLVVFSRCLKSFLGNNEVLVRAIIKRTQVLLTTLESLDASELMSVVNIFVNVSKYVNVDYKRKLFRRLLLMVNDNRYLLNSPSGYRLLFMLAHLQSQRDRALNDVFVKILQELCLEHIGQLDAADIRAFCCLLNSRRAGKNLSNVFHMLESHAVNLLSDESSLSDVIDILCVCTLLKSDHVLQLNSALLSRLLCCSYVDALSLSDIAKSLLHQQHISSDLLKLVQHFIVNQADNIACIPRVFSRIESFLSKHNFVDKELQVCFNDRLLAYLKKYNGLYKKCGTSEVSAYLLPVVDGGLPSPVFKQMISAATQWEEFALRKHMLRLSSLRESSTTSESQLSELNSVLYATLFKQLNSVDSLDSLHSVAWSLLVNSLQQDPIVADHVMNMFAQYSSTLSNDHSALHIVKIFHRLGYYLPAIYDDLVRYVVSVDNSDRDRLTMQIVQACGKVGYQPCHNEELLHLARCAYRRLIEQQQYLAALLLLRSLCHIQLFPDHELSQLFSLGYIEMLEQYMSDNPRRAMLIQHLYLALNRIVALECPHLNVPWFTDRAAEAFLPKVSYGKSRCKEEVSKDVESIMSSILGGFSYFQSNVYSQYFHYLNFKCVLDEQQKPVDVLHWNKVQEAENFQKVAVCVLGQTSYCYNSSRLNGLFQAKKRHLEIMNYKFVEIPYFDWFSMGLADPQSKLEYMEAKLFR